MNIYIVCGALVALRKTFQCCHSDHTSFPVHAYQNAEPRCVLCAYTKYAPSNCILCNPTATNEECIVARQKKISQHAPLHPVFQKRQAKLQRFFVARFRNQLPLPFSRF